jgi:hypothetical protein
MTASKRKSKPNFFGRSHILKHGSIRLTHHDREKTLQEAKERELRAQRAAEDREKRLKAKVADTVDKLTRVIHVETFRRP